MAGAGCQQVRTVRLAKDDYADRCRGAWAGQMIGVCWGEPYQFQSNGRPILGPIRPWDPTLIAGALHQDDCYAELSFLRALERHGLDITYEQAGRAFAEPDYALYHANKYARENIRHGILPPQSGHPRYNRHADDIDFQMAADVLGLVCPYLPRESNRLCDIFGHIMNYGDGVYGGMVMAGMYTAAFAPGADPARVVEAGLACIPCESTYHRCISDVVRWHRENPKDWPATWRKVEAKWQDDLDCTPGDAYNIDAKLNGAYVVMGLLYGGGDLLKTIEIAIRCGQDADTTAANAGGIVGCLRGYKSFAPGLTSGMGAIASAKFSHADYTFETVVPACQGVAEAVICRAGGRIAEDAYWIPVQSPQPPPTLEQWEDEKAAIWTPVVPHEVSLWDSRWTVAACAADPGKCVLPEDYGRTNLLTLFPITPESPAAITAELRVADTGQPALRIELASDEQDGPFVLKVYVGEALAKDAVVDTRCKWATESVPLGGAARGTVRVRIEAHAYTGRPTAAYIRKVEIR